MIVDGRHIARELTQENRLRVEALQKVPVVRAVTVAPTPATRSYLRIKERVAQECGIRLEVVELQEPVTTEAVIAACSAPGADAVIVQLPLPAALDTERIVNSIPQEKDADVLSTAAYSDFLHSNTEVLPPVVLAVREILSRNHIEIYGKKAVVVGSGKLVGRPVASWLLREGADVLVIREIVGAEQNLQEADILILGAGVPGLITPEMISKKVALLDAGTSESGGQVVGDADAACAQLARLFTPVPGGIGPVAVASLFRNVVTLLERGLQESKK